MNSAPAIAIVIAVLFLCGFNVHAQNIYNLKIPTGICKLVQDTPCFNDVARQKTFVVGKEVTSLSNLYEFCTSKEVVKSGKPARIILALDNSGSMCFEVTQCYGASNNDPTNKRVDGANAFVDSVASRCPNCQIGVIVYTGVAFDTTGRGTFIQTQQPLRLGDAANVAILHNVIDQARCRERMFKTQEINKLAKRTLTFTGMVLDSAIKMIDEGYDTISSAMQRHVILLTDGDWQRPTTSTIITTYNANYPDRQLPVIHGVFISDTATHVAQGFPPQGLVNCDSAAGIFDTMNLSFLKLAADTSHGMYFPGSTPQTIVATFDTLFKVIVDTAKIGLASVTFASQNTGEQQQANITIDPAFPDSTHYRVQVPSFQLDYGLNTFIITYVTQDPNLGRVTQTDTFTINRLTTAGTGEIEVFKTECVVDTVDMMIKCRPPNLLTAQFDTVTAKVDPNDVSKFVPNNIVVRAFTPFPDETDNRVLALFHLNDNGLANSAPGGQAGTGSNSLAITSAGAFGSAVRAGSFQTSIAMPISDDFTVECWITDSTGQSTDIIKGSNFSLGIANGYLTSTSKLHCYESAYLTR